MSAMLDFFKFEINGFVAQIIGRLHVENKKDQPIDSNTRIRFSILAANYR